MANEIESVCIRIRKDKGNEILNILKSNKLLNQDLKVKAENNYLLVPVINLEKTLEILKDVQVNPCIDKFEEYLFKPKKLNTLVKGLSSYLIIGNIAIINYKNNLELLKDAAEKIIKINPKIKSVYAKVNTQGEFRVAKLIFLAGERNTLTIHKENGLNFYVDIEKTYFNPRLSGEHERISNMVNDNEIILDMFTGVGGFPLNIAKKKHVNIIGIDLNPYAISLASRNVLINKIKGNIIFIRSDSSILDKIIANKFDRIIMNHPTGSIYFLQTACNLIKQKGFIHLYTLIRNDLSNLNEIINEIEKNCHLNHKIGDPKRVLDYNPKISIFEITINIS